MRRKLVKMGAHTLMSAIPKTWIKKNNLQKGNEIDFVEVENKLVLTSTAEMYEKKIDISIHSPTVEVIWRVLQPTYTSGYDEVTIHYKHKKTLEILEKSCALLIGFEIVQTTPSQIKIISVSEKFDENINPILKRVWFLVKQVAEITYEAFAKEDSSRLREIYILEMTINKYVMLLKRIINRTGYKYSHYMYSLISFLELAANHYEYIRRLFERNPLLKIKSFYADDLKKLNGLLEQTYQLQYSFSQESFNKIALELPHFKWFKDLPDDEIKRHFITIAEYLVQISRNIMSMNT